MGKPLQCIIHTGIRKDPLDEGGIPSRKRDEEWCMWMQIATVVLTFGFMNDKFGTDCYY